MLRKIIKYLLLLIAVLAVVAALGGWWFSVPTSPDETARMETSEYFADGKFSNAEKQAGFEFSWSELKLAIFGDERQTSPKGNIPVVAVDTAFLDEKPKPGLRFIWLGHASVLLEIDGVRLLLDPVTLERVSPVGFAGPSRFHPAPIALKDLRGIDAVLISHNHYDHMEKETIQHLAKLGTKIVVPLGNRPQLLAWGVPDKLAISLKWSEEIVISGVRLVATPTRHYSNRGMLDYKTTHWNSWTVLGTENRAFYSGDTGYSKNFAEIGGKYGPFDLGIIKIGAYGPGQAWQDIHMAPEEAVQTAEDVKAKVMLPVHWGTFNLAYHTWNEPAERVLKNVQKFSLDSEGATFRLTMPKPGAMVEMQSLPVVQTWWRDVE